MQKLTVEKLYQEMPETDMDDVTLSGWVRSVRDSKSFGFMEINDGTCFLNIQAVLIEESLPNYKEIIKTSEGSAVTVRGTLVITPNAKQPFELRVSEFMLVGASDGQYPLQKKRHSLEYLRTIAHLRPRTNTFLSVFRIRSLAAFAIHKYFNERGFIYVHTPIITASDCEGAGEMFQVTTLDATNMPKADSGKLDYSKDFFGKKAFLTVSGQLNVETFSQAFRNVYTFGPTFRAENSYTPRHAAEFWMIEPEMAFVDIWEDMAVAEDLVKYVIGYVMEQAPNEMAFLNRHVDNGLLERLSSLRASEFKRVAYSEAIEILKNSGEKFEYPVEWGEDIQTEHARYLTEKHFNGPIFVYDWPKEIKSFYMRQNEDGKTVAAADMLVPVVGELVGGSQREERMDKLVSRINELGLTPEDYWWYLELRRWGSVPHSGFGVGFERLVMYLTGIQNIRDVTPFPRTTRSAEF